MADKVADTNTWFLPKPKKGPDGTINWYPIVRVGRHVPFGYEQDPNDPDILNPIPEELELLELFFEPLVNVTLNPST